MNVFQSSPYASNPYQDIQMVEQMILKELKNKEWVSTGELYRVNGKTRRNAMHEALKNLLANKSIRMRVIAGNKCRDKTEFKAES